MLAARKTNLITARARRKRHSARVLANARKDHSIPLIQMKVVKRYVLPMFLFVLHFLGQLEISKIVKFLLIHFQEAKGHGEYMLD